jgi:hypothetical protein
VTQDQELAEKPIFVVFHKDCRHVAAIHNVRKVAETVARNLWPRQSDWTVRQGTNDDVAALLRGESCFRCNQLKTMP